LLERRKKKKEAQHAGTVKEKGGREGKRKGRRIPSPFQPLNISKKKGE